MGTNQSQADSPLLRLVTGGATAPGDEAPATTASATTASATTASATTASATTELEPPFDLELVFERYSAYVASIGLRLLGRDGEVDDLVQDVFVRVFRGLPRLRNPRALRAWLGRIAVHEARRRLRRRLVRRLFVAEEPCDYEQLADEAASPEERSLVAAAYRLLDHLSAETRIVWVLREIEGEPLDRVAELCGCSVSTVQRRLRAARTVMDEVLRHD